jgi:thioredoxin reductase (NADPH)
MTDAAAPLPPKIAASLDYVFPTLTPAQIARVAAHGHARTIRAGEVLIEVGESSIPFFVVRTGELEVIQPVGAVETLVARHKAGQFSGEVSMISGRRALFQVRAPGPGDVIEVAHDRLLTLIQMDAELSEILMRAFLLRRVELIAHGLGDVVLLGSTHSAATLRIKEFLTRNDHPYAYIDLDREADVQDLLDHFHVGVMDIPVLVCRGETVLRNPTNQQIASCLGFNSAIDQTHVRDVVIVGAGPSGLAAAVYGASEGLDVLVIESNAPGGQAGSSSRIENYLGFPAGVSGQELAGRAYAQAQKFGAQIMVARGATRLTCDRKPYTLQMEDGTVVSARTVIIATGAEYRRLPFPNLASFEGMGVYYGATFVEAQLCDGQDVIVVGGGNSAGQAAVFLAQTARHVDVLVRSAGLADSMSRYLIRRIEESSNIALHTRTEVTALEGAEHLERVIWHEDDKPVETRDIRHVFVMTGAVPNTHWLDGCVALDASGFVKTGADLLREDLASARWPLARPPRLLETSLPGVFAVGDVRRGSIKRVASAVGEGSIAVSFVHRTLLE